jgi:hypothetical protein
MAAFYAGLARQRAEHIVDLRDVFDEARIALMNWLQSPATSAMHRRDGRTKMLGIGGEPNTVTSAAALGASPEEQSALSWGPFTLMGWPILPR